MIVVDTNVISELMRPAPDSHVLRWVRAQPSGELRTTSVTVAEIRYGIERLPDGRRKNDMRRSVNDIFSAFADSVFPFDTPAAEAYARLVSRRDGLGLPIDGFDAQIAAICQARGADVATRNVKDFRETGINIIDPWQTIALAGDGESAGDGAAGMIRSG